MKPPHDARLFENVPIRRSTWSSSPNSSEAPAPRAPSTPTACASSTISRAPCAGIARRSRAGRRGRPPSRRRRRRPPARPPPSSAARSSMRSSFGIWLWRNGRSLAPEIFTPSRIDAWSPESQITVSLGPRIVPRQPTLAWWPVVKTITSSDAHPLGQLAFELGVERSGPVQEARPGQAGAVPLERVAGGLLDALVAGQAQVVVRAEHHLLGALDLHQRARLGLDQAEVGEEVLLARGLELLEAVVASRLLEDVDRGTGFAHAQSVPESPKPIAWRRPCRSGSARSRAAATSTRSSSSPSACGRTTRNGSRRCCSSGGRS